MFMFGWRAIRGHSEQPGKHRGWYVDLERSDDRSLPEPDYINLLDRFQGGQVVIQGQLVK